MKTLTLVFVALGLFSLTNLQAADPWKEKPILYAIWLSASTSMGEYELWAEDWKKGKRKPETSDYTINLLTETPLIAVQMALEDEPNPLILERCLKFLGTQVQPEFDHMWKARILEMADLDKKVTRKVNEMLKSKNLPSLEELAMTPTGGKKFPDDSWSQEMFAGDIVLPFTDQGAYGRDRPYLDASTLPISATTALQALKPGLTRADLKGWHMNSNMSVNEYCGGRLPSGESLAVRMVFRPAAMPEAVFSDPVARRAWIHDHRPDSEATDILMRFSKPFATTFGID